MLIEDRVVILVVSNRLDVDFPELEIMLFLYWTVSASVKPSKSKVWGGEHVTVVP